MKIIPAIDIIEGKCVRLSKGDYSTSKIYNENPLEVAKSFQDSGIQKLHLVDLDGAKSSHIVNWKVLYEIASNTDLEIDFGGGLKSDKDLQIAFENGASQVTGGSIAVKSPEIFQKWLANYGAEKIILGADAKNERIAISGWLDQSEKNVFEFISEYVNQGVAYCISTDIEKDGMLSGSSIEMYQRILKENPSLNLIASGGVASISELEQLAEYGLYGAIVGKAIYEGKIKLKELEKFILSC